MRDLTEQHRPAGQNATQQQSGPETQDNRQTQDTPPAQNEQREQAPAAPEQDAPQDSEPPGDPIPLWYRIPDGFHPVDFARLPEERLEEVVADLGGVYTGATREQLVAAALSFEVTLARLADEGVVHFSSFLLRTEGDELVSGVCQIAVVERPPGDPHMYPLSVLRDEDALETGTHQGIVELPAGLAAVTVSGHEVTVPGAAFGVAEDSVSRLRTVTFQLAFPHVAEAVSVSLATEDLTHDDEFLELATVFAAGISFTPPPEPPTEEELRAAERVHADMQATFG
ncbi:hypothetical protein [Streptomyces sp. HNM0574]|uniref:hypothetical protein n=1 Tax=Streptomyces sp. HNM0574 TaxID=2714954 RepID=UPI00146AE8E2|nr:hypothetical protein [Streptomyces sp. HNM0574]NLU66043.1 hypothetical protein [Streptomyces sp. HNM0574]